jgi:CHASE2 domain-containing sensor protein
MEKPKVSLLYKDAFLCTILTFIIAGVLYFTFVNLSFLDPFEKAFKDFKFTDVFYSERFKPEERNSKIVLVNVKHANRFQISQAIDKVAQNQPRVIGLDIIFKERKLAFTDSLLQTTIRNNKAIITSYFWDDDKRVENDSFFLSDVVKEGFINLNLKKQNSVIRDFVGVQNYANGNEFSFATKMAIEAGYITKTFAEEKLKHRLPINYIGDKDVFFNFSIKEILDSNTIPALKDAIIIFGYLGDNANTDFDIEDKHFTPLNKAWVGRSVPDTYGVTVHANILNMFMKKGLIYKLPNFFVYLFSFVFCFFTIAFAMKIYKRNEFVFDLSERLLQLIISVVLLYLALELLKVNIVVNTVPIILLSILGIELVDYYMYLITYINKKMKWKSYLLQS